MTDDFMMLMTSRRRRDHDDVDDHFTTTTDDSHIQLSQQQQKSFVALDLVVDNSLKLIAELPDVKSAGVKPKNQKFVELEFTLRRNVRRRRKFKAIEREQWNWK